MGIGPSGRDHMTLKAGEAIKASNVIVGYRSYIDRIRDFIRRDQEIFSYGMREEVKRARFAIEMAKGGKSVALISSGDPGIYGMASLVLELAPKDIDIEIVPGVTAATAAASCLGAPIACDFAVLSLSDLLVPWERILKRARLLAEAGMTVVIYNPSSSGRRANLPCVFELFKQIRKKPFWIGVVSRAFLPGQKSYFFLSDDPPDGWLKDVDMLSVVFFCDENCIVRNGKLILPRGYKLGERG